MSFYVKYLLIHQLFWLGGNDTVLGRPELLVRFSCERACFFHEWNSPFCSRCFAYQKETIIIITKWHSRDSSRCRISHRKTHASQVAVSRRNGLSDHLFGAVGMVLTAVLMLSCLYLIYIASPIFTFHHFVMVFVLIVRQRAIAVSFANDRTSTAYVKQNKI